MDFFNKIDSLILNYVQSFSDEIQRVFGIDNFTIAKYLLRFTSLVICFFSIPSLLVGQIGLCFVFLVTGLLFMCAGQVYMYFAQKSCEGYSTRNRMEYSAIGFRLWYWLIVILNIKNSAYSMLEGDISAFFFIWSQLSQIGFLYFASCIPKPPSQSKLSKLWEKFKQALSSQPEGLPA
jgi:hypothetical protein